jgi:hypothetical protein
MRGSRAEKSRDKAQSVRCKKHPENETVIHATMNDLLAGIDKRAAAGKFTYVPCACMIIREAYVAALRDSPNGYKVEFDSGAKQVIIKWGRRSR